MAVTNIDQNQFRMRKGESIVRRTIAGLTIFAALLTVTLSACNLLDPSPNATVFDPPATGDECEDVPGLLVGSAIYRCECAGCHGLDGISLADQVTDIRGFANSSDFEASLNNGPGSMPAFPALDSTQRLILFEYVHDSLGK